MIVMEFEMDRGKNRNVYWMICSWITAEDQNHSDEINEQLDAEIAFNL